MRMSTIDVPVNDAVILCAGQGKEMNPISEGLAKPLIHVMGRTVLARTITDLSTCGIKHVTIVYREPAEALLSEATSVCEHLGLEVEFVQQSGKEDVIGAVLAAKDALSNRLGGASFLLTYGDIVAGTGFYQSLLRSASSAGYATAAVVVQKEAGTYGAVYTTPDGAVKNIVEKPMGDHEPSAFVLAGAFVLPSSFLDICESSTDFVSALNSFAQSYLLSTSLWTGAWVDLGYPWDILSAVRQLTESMGASSVDSSARVSPTAVIEPPVIVEAGAIVDHHAVVKGPAYIGRRAYIGTGALIHGGSSIEEGVSVGAYTEVSGSVIQPNSSVGTGCFIGNSVLGVNVVFEPRVTTLSMLARTDSYARLEPTIRGGTAVRKLGSIVGNRARVGAGSVLHPGVKIKSGESVPSNTVKTQPRRGTAGSP